MYINMYMWKYHNECPIFYAHFKKLIEMQIHIQN